MLAELKSDQFERVSPLLPDNPQTVIPYAVCQGHNPGRVFVDDLFSPNLALIWTNVGYYFLCGEPTGDPNALQALSTCLTGTMIPASKERGEIGFVLVTSPGWEVYFSALLPGRELIHLFRRPFAFDQQAFSGLTVPHPPPGFELVRMDESLVRKTSLLACWGGVESFTHSGFGFALLHENEIAASCATVFISDSAVEIDVQTDEKYRRRGFSLITAEAFLSECIRRGKRPNWECFWDNQPSIALAARLGFSALPDFPVTYWEER